MTTEEAVAQLRAGLDEKLNGFIGEPLSAATKHAIAREVNDLLGQFAETLREVYKVDVRVDPLDPARVFITLKKAPTYIPLSFHVPKALVCDHCGVENPSIIEAGFILLWTYRCNTCGNVWQE